MDAGLRDKLLSLKKRDLETRDKLLKADRLYGTYDEDMQSVHKANAKELYEIVITSGWPGLTKVGLEGSRDAWLIAQHSICTPKLQREFLRCLNEASEIGEAPKKQVALLTDRILFNEGKPQLYGTVLDWNENGELGCELEDTEKIDELREAVGLPPFEKYLQECRDDVEAEGGKPPEDFTSYKKAAHEWSKSVGWR